MIKKYDFNYDCYGAMVSFSVDTTKFTAEMAKATLEFFTWDYDREVDPVDEVMKKYALLAIRIATCENYNTYGVMCEFNNREGYGPVDGSIGIILISVTGYEFDEDNLYLEILTEK